MNEWNKRVACSRQCGFLIGKKYRYKKGHKLTPRGHKRWKHPNVIRAWFKKGLIPWNKGTHIQTNNALIEWNKIHGSSFKGRKHTEQVKEVIREKRKLQKNPSGSAHWNWRGDTSPLRKRIQNTRLYRWWRKSVFERDNYTCQFCGKRGGRLNADHIYPFYRILKDYKIQSVKQAKKCKELWEVSNGRTLCIPCHKQTPSYLVNQHSI